MSDETNSEEQETVPLPLAEYTPSLGVLEKADRVTWHIRWIYEQAFERPTEVHSTGSFLTESQDTQPYTRTLNKLNGPVKFDVGFVENPRVYHIENVTKWRGQVRPSPEQQEAIDSTRVRVTVAGIEIGLLGPNDPPLSLIAGPELAEHLMLEPIGNVQVRTTCFSG